MWSVDGAGLSAGEQLELYLLLDIWDGPDDEDDEVQGLSASLRDSFSTPHTFINAMRDEYHQTVLDA